MPDTLTKSDQTRTERAIGWSDYAPNQLLREFHSAHLLSIKPKPISWLVEGILPLGTLGDVSGPPGDGKSTILLSLAEHISTGRTWFGYRVSQTPVAWVSGEASSEDAIARDLWRLGASQEADILFLLPSREMFRFSKQDGAWHTSDEGGKVLQRCRDAEIGLLIIDTIGSVCAGLIEVDNDQTRQLARHIRKETAGMTTVCISHTNQASVRDELSWRLHYLSRAGGNGFPGAIRWAGGVSKLQEQDPEKLGYRVTKDQILSLKLVAFGISKHNEMPRPTSCNNDAPLIFEIRADGALVLADTGGMPQSHAPRPEKLRSGRPGEERCDDWE